MKTFFVLNVRPHPDPLPRGEGTAVGYFIFCESFLAAGRARFARWPGAFLPLLGERAGVREVVTTST